MVIRRFLNPVLSVLIVIPLLLGGSNQGRAQNPTPPPPIGNGPPYYHQGKITPADREAAAQHAKAARDAAARAKMPLASTSAPTPGGTPDYFGIYPNYANSPQALMDVAVAITGGGGAGATARAIVGGLTDITLTNGGSDYTSAPLVAISGGGSYGATAIATIAGGAVTGFIVTNPGSGYTSAPTITFIGGGGTGAAATASVAPSAVTGIVVMNGGIGYTSAPTVAITGNGTGAAAIATVAGGAVTGITVVSGGTGYALKLDCAGQTVGIRKFVDSLPGLGPAGANNLGQYIPIAVADTTTYPGSDYYEIALVQYTETLHSDLPPTTLRGYVQLETAVVTGTHYALRYPDGTAITNTLGQPVYAVDKPHYLGPLIVAQLNRPTRIKFTNFLPTGNGGDLFIPVDTSIMGAGDGPQSQVTGIRVTNGGSGYAAAPLVTIEGGGGVGASATAYLLGGVVNEILVTNPGAGYTSVPTVTLTGGSPATNATAVASVVGAAGATYAENRATIHLHGGITPWISDGTAHQWITPAGENTPYPEGVSVVNVPDMPDPGPGSMTFFYTNEQSARLMFYHDHAYGITRLNVYAGEAAGYLLSDPVEGTLVNGGVITTTTGTTLTISAGTVPTTQIPLVIQDKTFVDAGTIAAQDPTWNWGSTPPTPHTGDLWWPHVYMPNQNPYDIAGANAMGRWDYGAWFWPPYTNLTYGPIANPYFGAPGQPPTIPGTPNPSIVPEAFMDTPLVNGTAYPFLEVQPKAYRFRVLNAANDRFWNLSLYVAGSNNPMWNPDGTLNDPSAGEVPMVPALPDPTIPFPEDWTLATDGEGIRPDILDGRLMGVPDPTHLGPDWIQIGSEGGLLPAPVVLPPKPTGYQYNLRNIVVLNVTKHSLYLGPAERADVVVDFSQFAGQTLILYNDAPAPVPAGDPRIDYYTGDIDRSLQTGDGTGGAPTTLPGYGPNTRTIMQIRVAATTPVTYDATPLNTALPAAFAASQPAPIVPQADYNAAYNANFPTDAYARIQDTSMVFTPLSATTPISMSLQPKAIQELFEVEYGRMNATLGVEMPFTNMQIQTTIPYNFVDPATEIFTATSSLSTAFIGTAADGTQIWKITHNGVDTHAIHWHMFNVQVINRVGWDGAISAPDPNELGWKETVRMNPLEDAIVALRPIVPTFPFPLPNSYRPMDEARSLGTTGSLFFNADPNNLPVTVINSVVNFGWEYVWHCHLLGHEENDMMRPVIFAVAPVTPTNLVATGLNSPLRVRLTWDDNALNATGFTIQRAEDISFTVDLTSTMVAKAPGTAQVYVDATVVPTTTYYYRVLASNVVGNVTPGFPSATDNSAPSNVETVSLLAAAPLGSAATEVTLTSSPNPSVLGQPMAFVATISPTTATTGTVAFMDGGTAISGCGAQPVTMVDGVARASCTTSALAAGNRSITAAYSGDETYTATTSTPALIQDVNRFSDVSLTSSVNPSLSGAAVIFTAKLSPIAATGTVTFTDGGVTIGGCGNLPVTLGVASCTTSALALGNHDITAVYSGNNTYAPSIAHAIRQSVQQASSVSLVSSASSIPSGTPVIFTATLTPGTATGTVTFWDGDTVIGCCSARPVTGGVATCSISTLIPGSHSITAVYNGDAANAGSTSNSVILEVLQASSSVALSTSGSPSGVGTPVTFTATVSPAGATGVVTFQDGGADITGCINRFVSGGTATCTTSALALGSHIITATYSGNASYTGSTSAPLTQVVDQNASSVVVASSKTPTVYGEQVIFTATVSPGTATGTVTFQDSGADIAGCISQAVSGGVATCATSALSVGSHSITAVYGGDATYAGSTSAPITQVVNQASSSVALSTSGSPSGVGKSVTFTATISPAAVTGTVTFKDGGADITGCINQTVSGGAATCTTSALVLGSHTITATYSGNASYIGSASSPLNQIVIKNASSVVVDSSKTPTVVGEQITFTATLSPSAATGTVTFQDGGTDIAGCISQTVSAGAATCATSSLSAGNHSITAVYSGDTNYTGSTSTPFTQVVNKDPSSVVVNSSKTPTVVGEQVIFTATVSSPAFTGTAIFVSPPAPTGTVTFQDGGVDITVCINQAVSGGVATCAVSTLGIGSHNITAIYSGDANYAASTSDHITQLVNRASSDVVLTTSGSPIIYGELVTFTATISPSAATGMVTFKDGNADITGCINQAVSGGAATCAASTLNAGSHSIAAVYSGDANYVTSTSSPITQVVNQASSSVALNTSGSPIAYGELVTFTATINPSAAGGTVTFKDGDADITGCINRAVSGGTATCATSTLSVGSHSITAVYSGDANYLGSTSPVATQVVNSVKIFMPLISR